jgi:hypothetical protein
MTTEQVDKPSPTTAATVGHATTTGASSPPGAEPGRNVSAVTRLMNQGYDETSALLEAAKEQGKLSGEATDISELIKRRLAEVAAREHAAMAQGSPHARFVDDLAIQQAFLVHRFVGPLRIYERSYRGYAILDNFLNVTSILAGVGVSLIAALDAPKVYAIVLGLVVGALQSLSQWLKPSRRSTRRGIAAAAMRSEGWAFLQGRDRYKNQDKDTAAWILFCDRIQIIQGREQAQQDKESAEVASTKGGAGGR